MAGFGSGSSVERRKYVSTPNGGVMRNALGRPRGTVGSGGLADRESVLHGARPRKDQTAVAVAVDHEHVAVARDERLGR
jgi:hypothetical protein